MSRHCDHAHDKQEHSHHESQRWLREMAHSWGGLGWFRRCVWHRGTGTARMKDKDGQESRAGMGAGRPAGD